MKEAFCYMFKDNKILQKYIALVLFILIPLIAIISIKIKLIQMFFCLLLIILSVALSGYWINCIRAIVQQSQGVVLPYINIKNNFITGLKWGLAQLILGLSVLILILFCLGLKSIIPSLELIITLLCIILFVFFIFLVTAFVWIFASTDDIYSYTCIRKALKYIQLNKKSYFIAVILTLILDISFNVASKFFVHSYLLLLLALVKPYFMFTTAYINAKAINNIE